MNAQEVFDTLPLGSLVRFSDGTPRPPERFKRKLRDWEHHNGTGILSEKVAPKDYGTFTTRGHFGLLVKETGFMEMTRCYALDSDKTFTVEEAAIPAAA